MGKTSPMTGLVNAPNHFARLQCRLWALENKFPVKDSISDLILNKKMTFISYTR